ncbi:MAG: hypothetical protein E4H14_13970 [Candidatus Thorarchaeota archaeon]|nr:MAG: hypothetical protein E4H14_13970 [Candidatus Thorarchaeota archaeon]
MDEKPRIKVKLKHDEVDLSIFIDEADEFESSYRLLKNLDKQRLAIDKTIAIEEELETIKPAIILAQKKTEHIWSDTNDWKLIGKIDDSFNAAVLSLLKIWPDCMSGGAIGKKIGKASSTVGDWLRGEIRESGHYFEKCQKGGYTLTLDGLIYALNELIPKMLGEIELESVGKE